MEIKTLNCPNCGSDLEFQDGIDILFCKYCGNKIIISGQSDAAYKSKMMAMKYRHEQTTQERAYQNEQIKWEREEISKEREKKRENKTFIICMLVLISMLPICFIPYIAGKATHNSKIRELNKISSEIEKDIENKNYTHALLLVNRLYINDGWGGKSEWDERRGEYIRIIHQLQSRDGIYKMLRIPFGSNDVVNYSKAELIDMLMEAGFKNIRTENNSENINSKFSQTMIEYVLVDGMKEYFADDLFADDVEIIISTCQN